VFQQIASMLYHFTGQCGAVNINPLLRFDWFQCVWMLLPSYSSL
jgi:hypothetical protein